MGRMPRNGTAERPQIGSKQDGVGAQSPQGDSCLVRHLGVDFDLIRELDCIADIYINIRGF